MKDVVEQIRRVDGEVFAVATLAMHLEPLLIAEADLGLPPSTVTRALAAYYRDTKGIAGVPCHARVAPLEGLFYVVLSSEERTLAVYRITNQGQLRRLRRWPAELNTEPTKPEEDYL